MLITVRAVAELDSYSFSVLEGMQLSIMLRVIRG